MSHPFRSGRPRLLILVALCGAGLCLEPVAGAADPHAEARQILSDNCLKCHGPAKQKGGLRLDSRAGAVGKGDSGAQAINPGKAALSEVMRRVTAKDATERMPPGDKALSAAQIESLRQWIDSGAAWPNDAPAPAGPARTELAVTDEDRAHWSFRPLAKVEPPANNSVRTPIDRFILAGLAAKNLKLNASADPRTLIRRVTYDLTGLPPTPEEVRAFVGARDPDAAYEALVDRLLASPHYGERWGRHWLDVARYADSAGYESDSDRPNAYHYRDFVIRALNEDMPYDEFVRRQLAGDELFPDDPRAFAATGFLAAGAGETLPDNLLEEERLRLRYNELDDMVSTTSAALLGLTVGCARCHDHKFDPIPTRDYYRLLAGLHSGNRAEVPLVTRAELDRTNQARADWERKRKLAETDLKAWRDGQRASLEPKLRAAKLDKLSIPDADKTLLRTNRDSPPAREIAKKHERALAVTDEEVRAAADDEARRRGQELAGRLTQVVREEPKGPAVALAFKDFGPKPATSWLFKRGDFHDRTTPVELGFLTVLSRGKSGADYLRDARAGGNRADTTYQRSAIAAWLTDADRGAGPLMARVIVNRIWRHHFGEGLVRTPNDFGVRGDRPTHPELLEWLADDLVSHGWKLKRFHRTILLSAAYRQSARFDPESARADPDNRLLWRMRPRRLEAEALRDALLAVGGTLNTQMHGPGFKAPIPVDAMVARNVKSPYPSDVPDTEAVRRRSVYMFHKRVIPYPLLQAFDAPDAQQCAGRRANTTVVPQALALLNDPFVRARAADFARRLEKEAGDDAAKCVDRAYMVAFGRGPADAEKNAGIGFLGAQTRDRASRQPGVSPAESRRQALTDYCQALFGLNEFLYVD